MSKDQITIAGAGVLGLWQAVRLARAGFKVRVLEKSASPFSETASRWAGAMLAPDCEAESAPHLVRDLGRLSIGHWRSVLQHFPCNGTLVVAAARDLSELQRFARATERHETLSGERVSALEPALAGRFATALLFPEEAHFDCMVALKALLHAAREAGGDVVLGTEWDGSADGIVVDARGFAAQKSLPGLRGVRGERLIIRTREVSLSRPVRLLHPRQPIYVVPQGDGRFVVGATVVEREDESAMTVRSALELLGSAYALNPAFAEAEVLDMGAGVRPAYSDNVPRVKIESGGRLIRVNGAYRHGFLLAPLLAEAVAAFLASGDRSHPLVA